MLSSLIGSIIIMCLCSRSSEGKTVAIPYKGPVADTIQDLLGGIRSTCTYVGARTLDEVIYDILSWGWLDLASADTC